MENSGNLARIFVMLCAFEVVVAASSIISTAAAENDDVELIGRILKM